MSLSRGAIISSSSKANTPRPGSGAREAQGSGGKDEDENEEVRADLYGACRPVASYQKLNQIGEVSHTEENPHCWSPFYKRSSGISLPMPGLLQGTYGYVYRAVERSTGTMVALKKVILHNEKQDGFPLTSLREIRMLKKVSQHPNCVKLLVRRGGEAGRQAHRHRVSTPTGREGLVMGREGLVMGRVRVGCDDTKRGVAMACVVNRTWRWGGSGTVCSWCSSTASTTWPT